MKKYFYKIAAICCATGLLISCLASSRLAYAAAGADAPLSRVFYLIERIKDPFFKAEALIKLSSAYLALGDRDKARDILAQALGITQDTENPLFKAILLSELIDKYIKLNDDIKATELAASIEFKDSRADAYVRIVNFYIQQGRYEKAIKLARAIDEPFSQALALSRLINELKKKKLYAQAPALRNIIWQASPETRKFIPTVYFYENNVVADNSEWDSLWNSLLLKSPAKDPSLHLLIGKKYASLNLPEPARDMFERAVILAKYKNQEYLKNEILSRAAIGYARIGDYQKAKDTVAAVKTAFFKSEALAQIAISYANEGHYKRALETASAVKFPFDRSQALAQIAINYAKGKDLKTAFQIIQRIDNEYLRDEALAQVTIQGIENREDAQVFSGIEELSAAAGSLSRVYLKVTDYYLRNKQYLKAVRMIKAIKEPQERLTALLEIAQGMQKDGYYPPEIRKIFDESADILK